MTAMIEGEVEMVCVMCEEERMRSRRRFGEHALKWGVPIRQRSRPQSGGLNIGL